MQNFCLSQLIKAIFFILYALNMAGSLPPTPNKATSQDLSLPPGMLIFICANFNFFQDVLAILDANRFFFKQPCKNPPILVDASSSKSISSVKRKLNCCISLRLVFSHQFASTRESRRTGYSL
jgi:hypothetical protein